MPEVNETNFEAMRGAFRIYDNALRRGAMAENRKEELQAQINVVLPRVYQEQEIVDLAGLIQRKRKAGAISEAASKQATRIYNSIVGLV